MSIKNENISLGKLVSLFFETGSLRKTIRSHRQTLLTDDLSDNIASHSFRVSVVGWYLAKLEQADPYKVLLMCLFHDFSESRSGDQNWIHKKYLKVFEDEIQKDQFADKPFGIELTMVLNEYGERKTLEAHLAKDADLLDQILLLREYEWSGNNEASAWLKGQEQEKRLFSKSAKKLAKEIYIQKPSSWWNKVWTAERR
jgi:putative hydrolase of HD superfamily